MFFSFEHVYSHNALSKTMHCKKNTMHCTVKVQFCKVILLGKSSMKFSYVAKLHCQCKSTNSPFDMSVSNLPVSCSPLLFIWSWSSGSSLLSRFCTVQLQCRSIHWIPMGIIIFTWVSTGNAIGWGWFQQSHGCLHSAGWQWASLMKLKKSR